ncbi:hypothetical protein [uncultured Gammaproteobacteria bacterium]|nr:hypothetical protein [uncultured Gammaproteobacteria bacterium]
MKYDNLELRKELISAIVEQIKIKELKQHDAAILLKIRQPKVCLLMNKKIENFRLDKLIELAGRVDLQVDLDIKLTT